MGLSSGDYQCPLNEGFRLCVCVCVCEEQGSAAHYSSDPLADSETRHTTASALLRLQLRPGTPGDGLERVESLGE